MVGSETNEIIKYFFEFFLQKYQEELEGSMRGSEFVYDSVDVLYFNLLFFFFLIIFFSFFI